MRLMTSRNALRARLDDVGTDARAPVGALIVLHVHHRFALRVLAFGYAVHLELAQHDVHAGRALDRLEGRIDRASPVRVHLDLRGRRHAADARGLRGASHCRTTCAGSSSDPRTGGRAFGPQHQRLDVAVEQLLLLVGERLEFLEHAVEFELVELEAQFLDPLAERVPAAVLAEHEVAARQADVLGPHDLVGRVVLEHAVLVDARFVRERVLADDRLVARNRHAGDARDQPRDVGYSRLVWMPVSQVEERVARLQRHHDFLQRAVAGALADAVDGAFDLARAGHDRGQAVGHRHAQIVVAMHATGGTLSMPRTFLRR